MAFTKDERFYTGLDGQKWPSVTTILSALSKPALVPWAVNKEREYLRTAVLEVLTHPVATPDDAWAQMTACLSGIKQADKLKEEAANIGKQAHALVEWHTRHSLGEAIGAAPTVCAEAQNAFEGWQAWAQRVHFRPIKAEYVVYHPSARYAGTADVLAEIEGIITLADYKSGRAIWPEAYLQNVAYRVASAANGWPSARGMIVRLPKVVGDPEVEAVEVPEWDGAFEDFLAVKRAWEWGKRMAALKKAVLPAPIGTSVKLAP